MIYNFTKYGLPALLVLVYCATLIKVLTGSRYKFVIKLVCMLMISNVCSVIPYYLAKHWYLFSGVVLNLLFFFARTIGTTCFNIAMWMFAFEYYSMSRKTPFLLKNFKVPKFIERQDRNLNYVMFSLNIIIPIFFGISRFVYSDYRETATFWKWANSLSYIFVIILQIITGAYQISALSKIKTFMNEGSQVNIKTMLIFGFSFGLYLFSIVVAEVAYLVR